VIPRAHITSWRAVAPWSTDAQVEQDLILSRALIEIFSNAILASHLAFRGGTALHKLFLNPASRYSEDIDLVQLNSEPIGPILTALHQTLDPWLGKPRRKQSEGRATLIYRFNSEIAPITPLRLKVEINTREHFSVFGYLPKKFRVKSPWFNGETEITTYSVEELLSTKVRALYQRKQGRDLFDLAVAFERIHELNTEKIVKGFLRYMEHDGTPITRAQFEANLSRNLEMRSLRRIYPRSSSLEKVRRQCFTLKRPDTPLWRNSLRFSPASHGRAPNDWAETAIQCVDPEQPSSGRTGFPRKLQIRCYAARSRYTSISSWHSCNKFVPQSLQRPRYQQRSRDSNSASLAAALTRHRRAH